MQNFKTLNCSEVRILLLKVRQNNYEVETTLEVAFEFTISYFTLKFSLTNHIKRLLLHLLQKFFKRIPLSVRKTLFSLKLQVISICTLLLTELLFLL